MGSVDHAFDIIGARWTEDPGALGIVDLPGLRSESLDTFINGLVSLISSRRGEYDLVGYAVVTLAPISGIWFTISLDDDHPHA